jgi:hypothetical protein
VVGLPFHAVALDGKVTALPCWDDLGRPVRTVTAALVTAPGRPCIDAIPVPASTNEMGAFEAGFEHLVATYGELFAVVTYDAGVSSDRNGQVVVDAGKDYLFRLRNGHPQALLRRRATALGVRALDGRRPPALDARRVHLGAHEHLPAGGVGEAPRR